jgi:hypothetical protein
VGGQLGTRFSTRKSNVYQQYDFKMVNPDAYNPLSFLFSSDLCRLPPIVSILTASSKEAIRSS